MEPSSYLDLSAPNLVSVSRTRRAGCVIADPDKPKRNFSLFFAPRSAISQYLHKRSSSGNAIIVANGRIVIGPKWFSFTVSLSLLLVTCAQTILGTTIPLMATYPILCTTILILFPTVIILALLTGLTNPGIVPRNPQDPKDDLSVDPKSIDSTTGFLIPRYLLLNGVCVRQKFCRTCKIYRPPRSNHCSVCDNCVLKFDHHCAALGTCVGLGNYRWFILLIAGLTILCPIVAFLILSQLRTNYISDDSLGSYLCSQTALVANLVISILGSFGFAVLFMYHYFITAHNLTTNEHLKKYYKVNPFDYGTVSNFIHCLVYPDNLFPTTGELAKTMTTTMNQQNVDASYKELASTNSECVSDFYDY